MRTTGRGGLYLLAALFVLAACGSAAAQEQSWLEGYWEGQGVQDGGQTWTVTLTVKEGRYSVKYPSLGCEGVWHVYDRGSKKMKFVERVNGGCMDAGMITVEKVTDDQIRFGFEAYNTRKTIARATLQRRPPPAPPQRPAETGFVQRPDPVHDAGEKLFENDLYAVYRRHPYYSNLRRPGQHDEFCKELFRDRTKHEARVNVVFNVAPDYVIEDHAEYRQRFESEILPAVSKQCPNVAVVYLNNYVRGVRINHDGREVAYGQTPPAGFEEEPLNYITAYVEPGGVRYEGYEKDSTSSRTYASLSRLRLTRDRAAAERATREAEQQRQAEQAQQERSQRRQDEHRAQARDVLALLKPHAPERFSFSGYGTQTTLEQIYNGDFKPFTGGYESASDATKSVRSAFGNADPRNPFGFLGDLIVSGLEVDEVAQRRRSINTIFYTYHNVYKDQCFTNKEVAWTASALWTFYVTRGGVKVEGSERDGVMIPVRLPYKETYDSVYSNLASSSNVTPDFPQAYQQDFRDFLKSEGCASPAVRRFEANLYLATRWLMPLQQLGLRAPEAPKPVPYKLKLTDDEPEASTAAAPPKPSTAKPAAAAKTKKPVAKAKPKASKKSDDKSVLKDFDWKQIKKP
jgi:hypothetical protein